MTSSTRRTSPIPTSSKSRATSNGSPSRCIRRWSSTRRVTKYYLKPMNCPFHTLIYKSRQRSYRELPLRYFEFGSVYRYEKSGAVHGLNTRVRGMTHGRDAQHLLHQGAGCGRGADAHAAVRAWTSLRDFGLNDRLLLWSLSTRPPGKAVGHRRGVVDEAGSDARERRDSRRTGARDGPRRRRLLRTQDLRAGP